MPLAVSQARWAFHAHLDVWLLILLAEGSFLWAVRRERRRPGGASTTRRQVTLFTIGVAALWIGADWPVHDVAEGSLYFVHMIQHLLFTMAAVPFMLAGTPAWMFRRLVRPRPVFVALKALCRPFVALVVFNVVLVFTHWPLIVTASIQHHSLHFGLHVLLFAAAVVMWMPVLSPVLEIPRLSYPGQMMYLFLQSLVPTIPASFLTFGNKPLYHIYETLPRLWGISPLTDQRSAGLIMKIVGGFILWGVITAVFFKWWKIEHSEGVDVLAYRNVDRELNQTGARP